MEALPRDRVTLLVLRIEMASKGLIGPFGATARGAGRLQCDFSIRNREN